MSEWFFVLDLKSLLASIFLIFELDVLGLLWRVLIFLFVFLFCLLIGRSSFHSIGRCYILGILNICLVLWLFFFYRCNFRCLVCFSLYCSWFRFPSVDCRVLWNLLLWSFYPIYLLVMILFFHYQVQWSVFLDLNVFLCCIFPLIMDCGIFFNLSFVSLIFISESFSLILYRSSM